jgi:hypothetical protein
LVICGWSLDRVPVSFALETGSHSGPGPEETSAFVLLPQNSLALDGQRPHLRPLDLRAAALRTLEQREPPAELGNGVRSAPGPSAAPAAGASPLDLSALADAPLPR